MAATKTFETSFRINAVWAGQKGVQQAQRQLGLLARTTQHVGVRVKGMARSVFAGVSAQRLLEKAVGGTIQVLEKSFAAANEAQKANDALGLSIERNAKRYKSTYGKSAAEVNAIVKESTQALIGLSEQMEKTGHDAETLQKGWAKLMATGALSTQANAGTKRGVFGCAQLHGRRERFRGRNRAQLGEQWADAVMRGNLALAKQMDLSHAGN